MGYESFTFKGTNGQEVFVHGWNAAARPRCIVQIIHGMAEHGGRYSDFAEFLNKRGVCVYASDIRGHGKTGEINGNLGDIDADGFNGIVEDQAELTRLLHEKHHGTPLFILGHSFGSFIAQEFMKRHTNKVSGVILTGSCLMGGLIARLGLMIASVSMLFGSHRPNRPLSFLSFGKYNKKITEPLSKFSWLSRDSEIVRTYDNDPFCGNILSTGFYYRFFKGLSHLYGSKPDVPASLPVAIFSGSEDPVGEYGSGPEKLFDWYSKRGMADLHLKLYEGSRHEILNETNKAEVYSDISAWLDKHLPAS